MKAGIMVGSKPIASQDGVLGICYFSGIAAEGFDESSEMRELDVAAVSEVLHVIMILAWNPTRRNDQVDRVAVGDHSPVNTFSSAAKSRRSTS